MEWPVFWRYNIVFNHVTNACACAYITASPKTSCHGCRIVAASWVLLWWSFEVTSHAVFPHSSSQQCDQSQVYLYTLDLPTRWCAKSKLLHVFAGSYLSKFAKKLRFHLISGFPFVNYDPFTLRMWSQQVLVGIDWKATGNQLHSWMVYFQTFCYILLIG